MLKYFRLVSSSPTLTANFLLFYEEFFSPTKPNDNKMCGNFFAEICFLSSRKKPHKQDEAFNILV
jgi:hypothetical protein